MLKVRYFLYVITCHGGNVVVCGAELSIFSSFDGLSFVKVSFKLHISAVTLQDYNEDCYQLGAAIYNSTE